MAIAHIVTFVWNSTASEASVAELTVSLREYVATLDGVISYDCGSDLGLRPGSSDYGIVGVFKDEEAFLAYAQGPEHVRILNEQIVPMQESRTALQILSNSEQKL